MTWLLLHGLAQGATITQTFCADYNVSFSDVNAVDGALDDDFILNNNPRAARGALLVAVDKNIFFTWAIRLDGSGCATLPLDDTHLYDVKLLADGVVEGNAWTVKNNEASGATWVHLNKTNWSPTGGTLDILTGTHPAWNIMAAVGWSFGRVFGVQNQEYVYFTEECPDVPDASCERSPNIFIKPSADDNKHIIAHETGHAMMESCNNNRDENLDSSASNGAACGGGLRSKEFQSNAANEGAAWYYAAMAFNDRLEADCEVARTLDYDNDGTFTDTERYPSCEGDPVNEPWANLDYLGNECSGTKTDRGVVIDYMRAFWDLTQDAPGGNGQGLFFGDVCDMWLEARPDTWDADGGGASGNDPENRLLDAASALGFSTEWNNVDNANGVHR